jgi:beta-lactamase regulating signal transducer with metallopeptidase domain
MILTDLLIAFLNMSALAAVVIAVISLARLPLSRAPKAITCGLWFVALFRLLCPVSFESSLSLFALGGKIQQTLLESTPAVTTPSIPVTSAAPIAAATETISTAAAPAAGYTPSLTTVLVLVWAAGVIGLLLYGAVSYVLLKRRIATATLVDGGMYESDRISSAFVCGILRPRIYVPAGLTAGARAFIVEHEKTHISRRDYLVKPLWFLAVCLHWFNPLAWLAFYLVGRDMEMRCDEAVIRRMGDIVKADYSSALLDLSGPRAFFAGSPLAFGEGGVGSRIKKVLNFKKPVTWVVLAALAAAVTLTVVLAANPKAPQGELTLASRLLENKTAYVGDNTKVGGIIALLDFPGNGGSYQGFELQTASKPYGVILKFAADSAAKVFFENETNRVWYRRDAALIISLVANADYVSFSLSDGDDASPLVITYTRDEINDLYGPDVRAHTTDADTLNAFIEQLAIQANDAISAAEASSIAASSWSPVTVPAAGTAETTYGFMKFGPDGVAVSLSMFDAASKKLAEDIITRFLLSSAGAEAIDLGTLGDYYMIREIGPDGAVTDYYAFLQDGRACLQAGKTGRYSVIDDALFAGLTNLIDAKVTPIIIDQNLDIIMSSPMYSSNPADYIAAHRKEYETILKIGDDALNYLLSCFEKGEGDTLKGHIMMALCNDLLGAKSNLSGQNLRPSEWYRQLQVAVETELPDYVYTGDDPILKLVYATETEKHQGWGGGLTVVAIHEFGRYEEGGMLKIIVTTYAASYHLYGKDLDMYTGSVVPAAITYTKNADGTYSLSEYTQAGDGSYYVPSIRDFCTMPVSGTVIPGLADQVLDPPGHYDDIYELQNSNLQELLKQNNISGVTPHKA